MSSRAHLELVERGVEGPFVSLRVLCVLCGEILPLALGPVLGLVVFAQVRDELLQHVQAAELDAADGAAEQTWLSADRVECHELGRHAVIKDATLNCGDRPRDGES